MPLNILPSETISAGILRAGDAVSDCSHQRTETPRRWGRALTGDRIPAEISAERVEMPHLPLIQISLPVLRIKSHSCGT